MIRITVELLPHGFEDGKRVLGQADIWNDLSGTEKIGNYKYHIYGARHRHMMSGEVKGFPRKRLHVWFLVRRVLEGLYIK